MSFDSKESDALHARVAEVIDANGALDEPSVHALALDIARHQHRCVAPLRKLYEARGLDPASLSLLDDVPAVPTDVFKLRRVAAHPPEQDRRVFRTSGTTIGARGVHAFRTLSTYERAAIAWGERWLLRPRPARAILLTPPFDDASDSSLGFMIDLFVRTLELPSETFVRGDAVDHVGLERYARDAADQGEAVIVFGTAFAYVYALDALVARTLPLAPGSRALLTGGFKGRTREVPEAELRRSIGALFDLPTSHVVGEYGMTELSSQLYEPRLVEAGIAAAAPAVDGVYVAPPWVRVTAVDPDSLAALPTGEIGLARIFDLANVDSSLAIQTQDRVRVVGPGRIQLLGRAPGAPPRGCSLAIEDILSDAGA